MSLRYKNKCFFWYRGYEIPCPGGGGWGGDYTVKYHVWRGGRGEGCTVKSHVGGGAVHGGVLCLEGTLYSEFQYIMRNCHIRPPPPP